MIEDRIQKIESRLKESANIPEPARAELLRLLAALKDEVGTLTKNHEEDARSLAGFVDASAHEATRLEKKPKQVEASLNGLTASVEAFEASHPKLAEVVNQIAVRLSNMGI
jgi:chromosome segregation ATPase